MIGILDYGMGNLHSVARAVEHVGGAREIITDPESADRADALIVPGVGAFGACMRALHDAGFDKVVRAAVDADKPVLGVCLGLQVLFETGEENPDDPGLGILPGAVRKLSAEAPAGSAERLKIPHMGWNEVRWVKDHPLTKDIPSGTRMYFVHSYAVDVSDTLTVGVTDYGAPFSAAVARGRLFATQFHPEKSGEPGLALYDAFVKQAA